METFNFVTRKFCSRERDFDRTICVPDAWIKLETYLNPIQISMMALFR